DVRPQHAGEELPACRADASPGPVEQPGAGVTVVCQVTAPGKVQPDLLLPHLSDRRRAEKGGDAALLRGQGADPPATPADDTGDARELPHPVVAERRQEEDQ